MKTTLMILLIVLVALFVMTWSLNPLSQPETKPVKYAPGTACCMDNHPQY